MNNTMMQRKIIIFVLLALVSSVHLQQYIDEVINKCRLEAEQFATSEEKYVLHYKYKRSDVDLSGGNIAEPQNSKIRFKVYEKQKLQRPFECICSRLDPFSLKLAEHNPNYQALVQQCKSQPQPQCDSSTFRYRTFDGTCNNLIDPKKGSIFSCLRRYVPARYEGVSGIRQSVCGKPLPNPRELSLFVTTDECSLSEVSTQMTTFFGQFLAHDITDVPKVSIGDKDPDCSPKFKGGIPHPECKTIHLPKDDPFYSKFHKTTFDDERSAICDSCTSLEKRTQMNIATAYCDLSLVYGLLKPTNDALRRHDGTGKMNTQRNKHGQDILPPSFDEVDRCGNAHKGEFCFNAGDHRVNQNTPLTALHTLFHLEHNRIADKLKLINPFWDDEKIFQEARKINIAQLQVIIYKEFLPHLLGPDLMNKYHLWISDGYTYYNSTTDAGLWVEFNTAAFRLHNTVNRVITDYHMEDDKRLLRNLSFEITPLYHGEFGSLLEGISLTAAETYDTFLPDDLKKFMLRRPTSPFGYDIYTINIDRGRDNGLPTYIEMVKHFLGFDINSFQDLSALMNQESIRKLKKAYCDVRDIDLVVGLWNERTHAKTLIGPTSAEIVGSQFEELKFGDRFYVEHQGNFKLEQLQSLRTVTLSSILCSNTNIRTMQLNAFQFPSQNNPILKCESIPKTNINLWKDNPQDRINMEPAAIQQPIQPSQFQSLPAPPTSYQPGQFQPVLSQPNQFQPVLSQPNQFHPVVSQLNQFQPVVSQPNQFQPVLSQPNQFQSVLPQSNQFQPLVSQPNQFQPNQFQSNQFQSNPFQPNPFQPNQFQPNKFQPESFQPSPFQSGQFAGVLQPGQFQPDAATFK